MKQKDLKKISILIGIVSFALGSVCAYVAYKAKDYQAVEPELVVSQEILSPINQFIENKSEKAPIVVKTPAVVKLQEPDVSRGIELRAVVEEAKKNYSTAEKEAKEGLLWLDQETGQNIITLGAINGLVKGGELTVYEGANKMGRVKIETLFDSISYVLPVDPSLKFLVKHYYKVVIE